ncbi:nicotinamide-nucleotide amidase [Ensifer adhaerens]|nr:nicotinamide-nucleotide amidase [Ensifer adhaerens]HZG28176.1 CinA family protein [Ensifer sp.]
MPAHAENIELARQVIDACRVRNIMIAAAESCTGGLIATTLTEIPGSSAVFDRGFVTYSNTSKIEMLGIFPITIKQYGAVSKETAMEMAHGALARSEAGLSIACTGIAGPDGGTPDKPVGLVHIAAKHYNGTLLHRDMHFGEIGRAAVRFATVKTALEMMLKLAVIDPNYKG